ncbi:MAG: hypothetical protein AB7G28_02310 [Pirellulales bacterium]
MDSLDHTTLHRTAKYFMDNGRAATHGEAMSLLQAFGLSIIVGPEAAQSVAHQTALLTLVNLARRTFLAGVEVVGLSNAKCASQLSPGMSIDEAVQELGGRIAADKRREWPSALIGTASMPQNDLPCWRISWQGWRAGVSPSRDETSLSDDDAVGVAPALAAAICAAEAFAYHAGDHPLAGRRSSGISLWQPGRNWLEGDPSEPRVNYLPTEMWIIGLGNLGQAIAWLISCLPYKDRGQTKIILQDVDRIMPSNESTSLLASESNVGELKTRAVSDWLERRGYSTLLCERLFDHRSRRANGEPAVAVCGVDNALARHSIEAAGFDLVIEAGLGAGPQGFRNIAMHTFPASRSAQQIWPSDGEVSSFSAMGLPAYRALQQDGVDECGLTRIASRTVAVPFVGLTAASLVISELLRRLNGGIQLEVASASLLALDDIDAFTMKSVAYSGGYAVA